MLLCTCYTLVRHFIYLSRDDTELLTTFHRFVVKQICREAGWQPGGWTNEFKRVRYQNQANDWRACVYVLNALNSFNQLYVVYTPRIHCTHKIDLHFMRINLVLTETRHKHFFISLLNIANLVIFMFQFWPEVDTFSHPLSQFTSYICAVMHANF